MQCPNCSYVRQAKDSIIPEWQCPQCGIAYAKRQAALNRAVKVRMVSGQETVFHQIKLYDADLIYQLDSLRRAAAQNFAGYSSGLGFWGSLEWVAAGSLVTGMIEKGISNQMAQEGASQLRQIAVLSRKLRELATYVQIPSIDNIQYPEIGMWKASIGQPSMKRELIHFSGEYVFVKAEEKQVAIFWDKVEQYELVECAYTPAIQSQTDQVGQFNRIGKTN
ncbi:MAG TPA: hypothetical protein VF762_19860 [Blastocatellia bacterium]|jgi:hypothetical protein